MSATKGKCAVSIIVPVYNAELFISECLQSIIDQDFDSFEVLVSDDCSLDNTAKILSKFETEKRIKIYLQPVNLGITKNCNFLLNKANGDYVCFFAGDDVMLPGKLHEQYNFMEANPSCSFSHHNSEILACYPGQEVKRITPKNKYRPKSVDEIIQNMGVPSSISIMARKTCIPDYMFDETYRYVSDWKMQVDLALAGDIGFIEESLCQYRQYGDNNSKNIETYEHEFMDLLNHVSEVHPDLKIPCQKAMARYLFGKAFRQKYGVERRAALRSALHHDFKKITLTFLLLSYLPGANTIFSIAYKERLRLRNTYAKVQQFLDRNSN